MSNGVFSIKVEQSQPDLSDFRDLPDFNDFRNGDLSNNHRNVGTPGETRVGSDGVTIPMGNGITRANNIPLNGNVTFGGYGGDLESGGGGGYEGNGGTGGDGTGGGNGGGGGGGGGGPGKGGRGGRRGRRGRDRGSGEGGGGSEDGGGGRRSHLSEGTVDNSGLPEPLSPGNLKMSISRPVYTNVDFNYKFTPHEEKKTARQRIQKKMKQFKCTDAMKSGIQSVLPVCKWVPAYKFREYLSSDLIAGITMGIVNIPQGLAYSILAGLPAVYGLYTTFFPVLIYFFMGTSKHLSMGTFAVVSLMCRETVGRVLMERFPTAQALEMGPPLHLETGPPGENFHLHDNGTNTGDSNPGGVDIEAERVKIHVALCLIVGILQVLMGICRCGFVTVYLSEALVRAFTTGAAFHVLTSQVPSALGIHVPSRSLGDKTPEIVFVWRHLLTHLGESNTATIIIFMISFGVIFITKEIIEKFKDRIKFNVPIELIVVAISIIVSKFAYMHSRHGVDTIFEIKTGFPPPRIPSMFGTLFGSLIGDSFAIAIVAFALSVSLSKTFATRNNYEIDANQEMLSYGVSNIVSSFFHCFVCCGALARTSIQEAVGGKTQIVTLVSSTMVMLVLLFMAPWFEPLPKSVLAAIICAGLKGMFLQFRDLHFLFRYSRYDFIIWVSTWAAVVFIGVDLGLGVGVIVALFVTVVRTQTPIFSTRGHVNGTELYKNVKRYPSVKEHDQVKIVQMQGSLYFANAEMFRNHVYDAVGINPVKVLVKIQKAQAKDKKIHKKTHDNEDAPSDVIELTGVNEEQVRTRSLKIKAIIIDCSHFGFVDAMGAKTMASLVKDFREVGVCVVLAGCSDSVMQSLLCLSAIRKELFYMTVHDAWLFLQNIRLQVESILNGVVRKKRPSMWKRFRTREATI